MKKSVIFLLGSIIVLGCFVFEALNETNTIIKYELKTSEYFPNRPTETKYYIEDEYELNRFYDLYSSRLKIDVKILEEYDLFIEVREAGSGSIKYQLSDVNIHRNEVEFVILDNKPEIGTDDMAFWYFVAQVPKGKFHYSYSSEWVIPSSVYMDNESGYDKYDDYKFELDNENKYLIVTDFQCKTMMNDGGSHTNIYYNIDLENNIVQKVKETYKANLGGTPRTTKEVMYTIEIPYYIEKDLNSILNGSLIAGEASPSNYNYYILKYFDKEIYVYDLDSIRDIENVLDNIDLLD